MSQLQATGLWWQKADFSEEVAEMGGIASAIRDAPLPDQIPLKDAEELFSRALKASGRFVSQGMKAQADMGNLIASNAYYNSVRVVQRDQEKMISRLLYGIIQPARGSGVKTVASAPFKKETSTLLMSVVYGFEALEEIDAAKTWWLRGSELSFILSLFVSAGVYTNKLTTYLYEPLAKLNSSMDKIVTLLKWGSIAGGMYYLSKALKPKAK